MRNVLKGVSAASRRVLGITDTPEMVCMPQTADAQKRRRKGQVGVMDRGLAAVLGAAALLGLIGVYFHNTADTAADNQVDQINTIGAEVARLYGAQSAQFNTLTEAVVAQSGAIPPQWTNAGQTQLISVYKSQIKLLQATNPVTTVAAGAWTLELDNVPQAACTVIGTTTFAPTMLGTSINGTVTGTPTAPVGDPATVTAACKAQAAGTGVVPKIIFTFS